MVTSTRASSPDDGEISESGRSKRTPAKASSPVKDRSKLPPIAKKPVAERTSGKPKPKPKSKRTQAPKSPSPPPTAAEKRKIRRHKKAAEEASAKRIKMKQTGIKKAAGTKAALSTGATSDAKKSPAKATKPSDKTESGRVTKKKTPTEKERSKASTFRAFLVGVVTLMQDDNEGGYTEIIGELQSVNEKLLGISEKVVESEEEDDDDEPISAKRKKSVRGEKTQVVSDEE